MMSNIIVHKCLAAAEQARECALTHNINVHKWLAAAEEAAEGVAYLVMSDPEDPEPARVKGALQGPEAKEWREALEKEMAAMVEQGVWDPEPVELPPGKSAVDSKVIFKWKKDDKGQVARYKARLVARGFSQRPGEDYGQTFASVAKMPTIRLLLGLAAEHDMEVHLADVDHAFLYASLEHEVYLKQPKGADDGTGRVLRLRKALYGLKQSPREWGRELESQLNDHGFTKPMSDQAIFMKRGLQDRVYLATWVDDLLVIADHMKQVKETKAALKERFSIKDLGEVRMYQGVHITRDQQKGTLDLGLERYITTLEDRFRVEL